MTIQQAIAELADRDLDEVVKLLVSLQAEIRDRDKKIIELSKENQALKFGEF